MLMLYQDKFIKEADKIMRNALRQQKIALFCDSAPGYQKALIEIGELYAELKKQEEF